jgi:hypothetical protein
MFKFEYNGVVYTADNVESLQETLKNAGLNIDIAVLLNEQQEVLDEVLNEQQEIVDEVLNEQQEIVDEHYQEQLLDKSTNTKLN